jgi:hypothetical protein
MKKLLAAIVLTGVMGSWSLANAEEATPEKLELKDGGTLYLHPDGTSRMVDAHGQKMEMADGKEMELKDGQTVLMQNKKVWVRYGPPSKQHEHMKND